MPMLATRALIGALVMAWIGSTSAARDFGEYPGPLLCQRRRTGGRTGQRVQLLRDLDQQAGLMKNQSDQRGYQRFRVTSCR